MTHEMVPMRLQFVSFTDRLIYIYDFYIYDSFQMK